ncbi:glycosyltransferase family 2 protein [Methylibium sp.]|uniref:glycosyltransferase family 2 protein n=1 Tax=Methylibium sp. TaxID=2067992 RepID=UPI0025F0F04E|nr:glycosyltransferase family 2 protein [Methylibium sp.]
MSASLPGVVSVIAPCRNERAHVAAFCDEVAHQRLPEGVELEVLIADGDSDDGTRELLAARCAADSRFVLVDNPARIVSSGLNRCLQRAHGEVIVRMDLHTGYADDYIAECLAALARSGAANVGGPWRADSEGALQGGIESGTAQRGEAGATQHEGMAGETQRASMNGATQSENRRGATQREHRNGATRRAIAAAFQSRWVAGGALSRNLDYEGPVDTVYLGCWPRATFERFGGFDENLVRNQDDEHNLRLVLGGATVWQSARIRSSYRPRASLSMLFRQQLQYGYWKPFVMRKHGRAASLRQLVPGGFVALLALLTVAAPWLPAMRGALALLGLLYAAYVATAAIAIARNAGWALLPRLPVVIAATHFGYGLGSLRGWLDVLRRGAPSPACGSLTR